MELHDCRAQAARLDRDDALAGFRRAFVVDDPELIYLDGNSLGRLPRATRDRLRDLVEHAWGRRLIRGWNEGWMEAPQRVGAKIARLVGARDDEVIVADSTTVNLFKLAHAALEARPDRHKIVTDDLNFPSDHHVLQGLKRLFKRPVELQVVPSPDGIHGPVDALREAIDEHTALVTLSHTAYKTSYTYDLEQVTAWAEDAGALALWDLSHSVGSLPIELNEANVPLAVGCTYKHLNGGPGAPAFLHVRKDLQQMLENPLSGWMGHARAFDFDPVYEGAGDIRKFLTGTPFILSLCAIEPSLDLFLEAGIERVRAKSVWQTDLFVELWQEFLEPLGFTLHSPRNSNHRGAHVSLAHEHGLAIDQALIRDMNVIPDFRPPNVIRFGFTPLYTTHAEVVDAVERLRRVVTERIHEQYKSEKPLVT